MQDIQEVHRPDSANALTDTAQLRLLEPFFRAEVSLSDAAEELGMKLNTLLYRVNKFIALDILEVARELPRKGKATKLYRVTAKAFFIPFVLTSSLSLEEFFFTLTANGEKLFHREVAKALQIVEPDVGFLVSLNTQEKLMLVISDLTKQRSSPEIFLGPSAPAIFLGDGSLRLDFETAKAFQHDLFELFQRYTQRQTPDAQLYAYRLGLTPVSDDSF